MLQRHIPGPLWSLVTYLRNSLIPYKRPNLPAGESTNLVEIPVIGSFFLPPIPDQLAKPARHCDTRKDPTGKPPSTNHLQLLDQSISRMAPSKSACVKEIHKNGTKQNHSITACRRIDSRSAPANTLSKLPAHKNKNRGFDMYEGQTEGCQRYFRCL